MESLRKIILKELYKSTYNSAAAKSLGRGDEELALDFLRHSNDVDIEDDLSYDPKKVVHKDDEHIVIDKDLNWEEEIRYDDDNVSYEDDEWMVIDTDKPNYDFYGVGPSDLVADGISDDVDDELSVDRFDIRQRIQSELNTMLKENVSFITPKGDTWTPPKDYSNPQDKGSYNKRNENYMFFQNLKEIRDNIDTLLNMNESEVDQILSNGHDWATEHIATAKDDIEEVTNFLKYRR